MTKKIKEDSNSIKILWISPNLVHYKIKNLSYLHQSTKIRLMTISGHRGVKSAEIKHNIKIPFKNIKTRVHYRNFGLSKTIRSLIKKHIVGKNWLLIPLEKKFIPLLFYSFYLKYSLRTSQPFKIFSYNHDLSRSNSNLVLEDILALSFFYV